MIPLNRMWCLELRTKDGAPVPRWQQAEATWLEGLVKIAEELDEVTGRHMQIARLHDVLSGAEIREPLLDTKILVLKSDRMILTGLQRDILTRKDSAQAWLLMGGFEKPQGAGVAEIRRR